MASEQLSHRDNTTTEKEMPQGSIQEFQGGEQRKEHAGKAMGDMGGPGRARETQELGTQFESIADKVKDKEKESYADKARTNANAPTAPAAEGKDSAGEAREVDRSKLESRTREVSGRTMEKENREDRVNRGQVVAEKGRSLENRGESKPENLGRGEVKGRVGAETQGPTAVATCTFEGGEKEERGRDTSDLKAETERTRREENRGTKEEQSQSQPTFEDISKYRGKVQENTMEAIRGAQERYERAKKATSEALGTTTQTAQEKAAQAKDTAMEKAAQAKDATLEKSQQGYVAAKDTVSSATKTAAEYATPVAEKAKDYTFQAAEMAKSAAGTTTQYVGEKAVQAKDVTVESGKTAAEYAGKVAADLKDKATVGGWAAAHYGADKTVEGTKAAGNIVQGTAGYMANRATVLAAKPIGAVKGLAATAGETAKDYTARKKEEAEREYEAKRASQPQTGQEQEQGQGQGQKGTFQAISETFQGEGGGRSRDSTKEGGGIGETISQYAQSMTPSGETLEKVGETVGNIAQKVKKPLNSVTQGGGRSGDTTKGGGGIGETISQYAQSTASSGETLAKVGETVRNVAKTVKKPLDSVTQGGGRSRDTTKGGGGIGETISQYAKSMTPSGESLEKVGETVGNVAQTVKKPLDSVTQGGSEVLGAVGETVGEIGDTMIKPAERASETIPEGQVGSGVLGAVGETISEIAETTKNIVVGDDQVEPEAKQRIGTEPQGGGGFKHEEAYRKGTFDNRKS